MGNTPKSFSASVDHFHNTRAVPLMPNSPPPPRSPPAPSPPSTLNLSIPSSGISVLVQEALFEDPTPYNALLRALRDATSHTRKCLSTAIELADIMETSRAALKNIRSTLDDPRVDAWSPNKYDSNKLMNPGSDPTDPDCYFSKHATPKARVRFRITSKEIYYRVKRLDDPDRLKLCSMYDSEDYFDSEDNHEEISEWIGRFTKWLEVKKTDGPSAHNEPRKAGSGKRKQANANPSSKRKAIRASSPAMQSPRVPYRSNNAQVADTTNQNMPPYQNQPAQQIVQQDTFRMNNLAHLAAPYQGGLMTPRQYYQEQQSSQGKCNTASVK